LVVIVCVVFANIVVCVDIGDIVIEGVIDIWVIYIWVFGICIATVVVINVCFCVSVVIYIVAIDVGDKTEFCWCVSVSAYGSAPWSNLAGVRTERTASDRM
jgi:hypothetical protein